VYDLSAHAAALNGLGPKPAWGSTGPCFSFSGHTDEGFALDWSKVVPGQLVSGDCAGKIHVWMPSEGGGGGGAAAGGGGGGGGSAWSVETAGRAEHSGSVEDLQWSPSEPTVFISCGVDKSIKVSWLVFAANHQP
jgi:ribosome assembly protein RRB1